MDKDDKAQAWQMGWTWTAVFIGVIAGGLKYLNIIDSASAVAIGAIGGTIITAVWVKRPGDKAPEGK